MSPDTAGEPELQAEPRGWSLAAPGPPASRTRPHVPPAPGPPQPHLAVIPAGDDVLPVGRVGQRHHAVEMALLLEHVGLALPFPHEQLAQACGAHVGTGWGPAHGPAPHRAGPTGPASCRHPTARPTEASASVALRLREGTQRRRHHPVSPPRSAAARGPQPRARLTGTGAQQTRHRSWTWPAPPDDGRWPRSPARAPGTRGPPAAPRGRGSVLVLVRRTNLRSQRRSSLRSR